MFGWKSRTHNLISLTKGPRVEKSHPPYVYYYSKNDKKQYIILTPSTEDYLPLQRYDTSTDKWEAFAEYPANITLKSHTMIIDNERDLLYVFGGYSPCFAVLNLNTNQWNVLQASNGSYTEVIRGKGVMLPNGEIHVLDEQNSDHIRYNKHNHKFASVSRHFIRNKCYFTDGNIQYIPNKQWLIQPGGYFDDGNTNGYTDQIWYTQYSPNKSNYVWKEFPLKLPYNVTIYVAVAFGAVLIILCSPGTEEGTWVLDLGDNNYIWVKSKLDNSKHPRYAELIVSDSNELYFVNGWSDSHVHFKIHLKDFLPDNIYNKYVNNDQNNNTRNLFDGNDDYKCNECDKFKRN